MRYIERCKQEAFFSTIQSAWKNSCFKLFFQLTENERKFDLILTQRAYRLVSMGGWKNAHPIYIIWLISPTPLIVHILNTFHLRNSVEVVPSAGNQCKMSSRRSRPNLYFIVYLAYLLTSDSPYCIGSPSFPIISSFFIVLILFLLPPLSLSLRYGMHCVKRPSGRTFTTCFLLAFAQSS